MGNNIDKKEIGRFLIAGFTAVGTDASVYYLLINFLSYSPAKATSFISGTIVAFIINKYWTFKIPKKSYTEMVKFGLLYLFSLTVNVSLNKLSLIIMPEFIALAFLIATGASTIINFIGQKFWIFKKVYVTEQE